MNDYKSGDLRSPLLLYSPYEIHCLIARGGTAYGGSALVVGKGWFARRGTTGHVGAAGWHVDGRVGDNYRRPPGANGN